MRTTTNQVRIIGGQLRGRKLQFPDAEGLRPTPDRVRETLFNWLMLSLQGAHCLDLFAGSGVLGIEALSRGAAGLTLIEQNRTVFRSLETNITRLELPATTILHTDALAWLKTQRILPFQIVFVDPPYELNLLQPALKLLAEKLPEEALIYWETPINKPIVPPAPMVLWKQKQAGQVIYSIGQIDRHSSIATTAISSNIAGSAE